MFSAVKLSWTTLLAHLQHTWGRVCVIIISVMLHLGIMEARLDASTCVSVCFLGKFGMFSGEFAGVLLQRR